jgi:V8-like Glu-specific endopeptidase
MCEINAFGPLPMINGVQPAPSRAPRPHADLTVGLEGRTTEKWIPGAMTRKSVNAINAEPWNAIGLLNLAMHGQVVLAGSGFMCAPDVFLTARHNLTTKAYDAAGVWIAYDHKRNQSAPIAIRARAWHSTLDLAVLILAVSQSSTIPLGSSTSLTVSIGGYGIPYMDGTMWLSTAEGVVKGENGVHVGYAVNTQEGDSGAPVLARLPGGAFRALAVHTTGQGSLPDSNFGSLLTPQAIAGIGQLVAFARNQIKGE